MPRAGRTMHMHCLVDWTLFPSGSVTVICCALLSIDLTCAPVIKKLLVATESKIAHCLMFWGDTASNSQRGGRFGVGHVVDTGGVVSTVL